MFSKAAVLLMVAIFLAGLSQPAEAALKSKSKSSEIEPAQAFNPNEDPGDMELPMPNGMKLVLRPVAVDSRLLLNDRQFNMGLLNPDSDRTFREKQFPAHISAALRYENLPGDWARKLPDEEQKGGYSYYLIGKYELSNGQWDAVMGGEPNPRPDLPKTGISWYDLQDFLRKYNEWLLKNHPDAVPAIDGVAAYLRLPTEEEWEFAAREGISAPEQQNETDFPVADGNPIENYAVFGDRYKNVQSIGSRKPNRLGIHDMGGNAAELVQSGFRFTVAERKGGSQVMRQHGSEGGLLRKGGSYKAASEREIYPGTRQEIRMFEKTPDNAYVPHKENDLGARLVLAAVNLGSDRRTKEVMKEEQQLQATPEVLIAINQGGDPVAELEKIYSIADTPQIRQSLAQYKELIQNYNEAFNREHDANLLSAIRSAAYKADSLGNIAFRCYRLSFDLDEAKQQFKDFSPKVEKAMRDEMQRNFRNLQRSTAHYRQSLREIMDYPKEDVEARISILRKEYAGDDRLNKNLRANLDTFAKHLDIARKQGVNKVTDSMIWDAVIPGKKSRAVIADMEKNQKKGGGK